ncbi:MAG: DNA polymerase III subunit gamma/tau [Desulfopila sp.]
MSYLVLARKYRPQKFGDVVGQMPVVKTLQNSLIRRRIAHAILFSGVRGVGKTTLARIMAKAINCKAESFEAKPCDACPSCLQIKNGQSLDLHEIDGASNRGIQEIRELKEKIRFLPTSSKYKIIIIDEVHMLTTEAFNALLKTLEEPPDHVYFMFATTELHKIPVTILSRCQRYELKRVSAAELTDHFEKIAALENITIDPAALALIVREAEGSVRDGFSLLDQMFSFGDQHIGHDDVTQVLGLTDRNVLMSITGALLHKDRLTAIKTLDQAFDYGIDIKRFTADLLECFRTLLLIKTGNCYELIDLPQEEIEHFKTIAEQFSFETIHLKLTLLIQATEELRHTTQPRLTLETAFFKIIEAGNVVPVSTLLNKIDSLIEAVPEPLDTDMSEPAKSKKKVEQQAVTPEPPEPPGTPEPQLDSAILKTHEPVSPMPPEPVIQPRESSPQPPTVSPPEGSSIPLVEEETATQQQDTPSPSLRPHSHTRDIRRDWTEFIDYVKERKMWMAKDLQRADSTRERQGELHLHYSDPVTCTLLRNKENRRALTEFVLDFFQKDLTVRFIVPDQDGANDDDSDSENPHKARQELVHDPLVQMAVEIFNGQVGDIRIGPRSR